MIEFPNKISKHYDKGQEPDIIIRVTGNHPAIKRVEYRKVRTIGNLSRYKRM
jgi:hypothetical protein